MLRSVSNYQQDLLPVDPVWITKVLPVVLLVYPETQKVLFPPGVDLTDLQDLTQAKIERGPATGGIVADEVLDDHLPAQARNDTDR